MKKILSFLVIAIIVYNPFIGFSQPTMTVGTNFNHLVEDAFKPFKTGVNFTSDTNVWNPTFINEVKIYECFRLATLGGIKNSAINEWSDRRKKTDAGQDVQTWNTNGTDIPNQVSLELLIDLCNRTGVNFWHPIFHRLVDRNGIVGDFILKMAILVKTGIDMNSIKVDTITNLSSKTAQDFINMGGTKTCEPLNSSIKWYVEYSNETWNSIFLCNEWCKTEGTAIALDANQTNAGYKFHAWACIRIWDEIEKVFGKDNSRIVKVCSGWTINYTLTDMHLAVFNNSTLNPTGQKPHYYAIAPYFSYNSSDNVPVEERLSIATLEGNIKAHYYKTKNEGIGLIAYEGGSGGCWEYPELYDVFMDYMSMLQKYMSLFCNFVHTRGGSECYGATKYTGQPMAEAYKYHAMYDWQNNHIPTTVKFIVKEDGKPIENAQVSFCNDVVFTDASGTAVFRRFYNDSDTAYSVTGDSIDMKTGNVTFNGSDLVINISYVKNPVLTTFCKNILLVYPNPAHDHITIQNAEEYHLNIINVNGLTVLDAKIITNHQSIQIDMLNSAYYIIQLQEKHSGERKTFPFIKY